jgi:hypothetical protein
MTEGLGPDREELLADWREALQSQEPLGKCQQVGCDGKLRATPAVISQGVVWLEAECDTCHRGVALPNGRRKVQTPGAFGEVHQVALSVGGPDWRERAVGPDY